MRKSEKGRASRNEKNYFLTLRSTLTSGRPFLVREKGEGGGNHERGDRKGRTNVTTMTRLDHLKAS